MVVLHNKDLSWGQAYLKRFMRKPFLRIVLIILFITLGLVVYQFIFIAMIDNQEDIDEINMSFKRFPRPSSVEIGQFLCTPSGVKIPLRQLNDDYCDCPDGSDEPKTDACLNSVFHCKSSAVTIPSSRVNDGICDCCDGSDEWKNVAPLIHLSINIQHKTQVFYPPCPNRCPKPSW